MSYFSFPNDPHVAARFFCFMGYSQQRVVNFLTDRLGVHELRANEIVGQAARDVRESDKFLDSEVAKDEAARRAEFEIGDTHEGGTEG